MKKLFLIPFLLLSFLSFSQTEVFDTKVRVEAPNNIPVDKVFNVLNFLDEDIFVVEEQGNVGIGVDTPGGQLHVVGTTSIIDSQLRLGNNTGQAGKLFLKGTLGPEWEIEAINDVLRIDVNTGASDGSVQLRGKAKTLWIREGGVGGQFRVGFSNIDTQSNRGGFIAENHNTVGSNGTAAYMGADGSGAIIRSTSYGTVGVENDLQFQIGGNTSVPETKMLLDTSGNLGIGTTSPTAKLQIQNTTPSQDLLDIRNFLGTNVFSINDNGGLFSSGTDSSIASSFTLGDKSPLLFSHSGYGVVTPNDTAINIGFRARQNSGVNSYDYFTYKVYENSVSSNVTTGFEFYTHQNQISNSASQLAMSINGDSVGIGTDNPDDSSILQVVSTIKGTIPFSVMTQAQRTAIPTPATGLHVYQTDGTEGVYVNKSTGWSFAY